jgi:multisubunit Na+/H+ antiporter MnhB subunit
MVEIHLLLLFMIASAVIAVEIKDLLSSVIAIGAVGIGLCMTFLALKAPDLAMLQLVVELLSLVLLIRATIRKDLPFSTSGRWLFNTLSTVFFVAVFIAAAYNAIKELPAFGQPAMRVSEAYIRDSVPLTGDLNIISAITLNFRLLDTLGEMTILFAAVVGVLAVARRVSHRREAKR